MVLVAGNHIGQGSFVVFQQLGGSFLFKVAHLFAVALVGVAIFGAGMSNAKEERKQAPEKLRQYEKDVAENERQMQANRKALALVDQDYDVLRQRYNKATSLL